MKRFSVATKISSSSLVGVSSSSPASTRAPQSANMVASPPSSRIRLQVSSWPQSKIRQTQAQYSSSVPPARAPAPPRREHGRAAAVVQDQVAGLVLAPVEDPADVVPIFLQRLPLDGE